MTTTIESSVSLGARIKAEVDDWARFSAEPDRLTRLYLTPEHRATADAVMAAMEAAGMSARIDPVGNVVGRYEGAAPGAKALLTGSHIDTVRDAGAYDGNLGVALPIACVAELHKRGKRLDYAIEIIAFGDEEGVRFPTTLSGSRTVAGTFDRAGLEVCDAEGTSLAQALRDFGCDPDGIAAEARRTDEVLGFVEVHIEQGPVLESEGLPVGIVTAINGASRFRVTVGGMAGHAGTVPMTLRRDALAGAAEMVLAIERRGGAEAGLVATVGRLSAEPGATNVIPGDVTFTLDLRAPDDAMRDASVRDIRASLEEIAGRRGLTLDMTQFHAASAVACDGALMGDLEAAIARGGIRPLRLPSGAGHDAMAIAPLCPIAMLFVRCGGGISHNPAETVTPEDVGTAAAIFLDFIENFEPRG